MSYLYKDREDAIAKHRTMWRTIAEETRKQKRIYHKSDYIKDYDPSVQDLESHCYACDYAFSLCAGDCSDCLFHWPEVHKTTNNYRPCIKSYYFYWRNLKNDNEWERAADLAEKIANLDMKPLT